MNLQSQTILALMTEERALVKLMEKNAWKQKMFESKLLLSFMEEELEEREKGRRVICSPASRANYSTTTCGGGEREKEGARLR